MKQSQGITRDTTVSNAGISLAPIEARLMLLPIRRGIVRLVWNFQIHTGDRKHAFDFTVDADSGDVWTRFDWTSSSQYTVYAWPIESPNHTLPLPPNDGRTGYRSIQMILLRRLTAGTIRMAFRVPITRLHAATTFMPTRTRTTTIFRRRRMSTAAPVCFATSRSTCSAHRPGMSPPR